MLMLSNANAMYTLHVGQNSKQINIEKYVSKFLICGAKMLNKCVKSKKIFLYIVLFCKVKLCKMASIKTKLYIQSGMFWFDTQKKTKYIVLMDVILFSLTLQKRTMYKFYFWLLIHLSNIFAPHMKNSEMYFATLIWFEFWPLW